MSADEAVQVALRFRSKSVMQCLGAICDLVGRPLSATARDHPCAAILKSARSRFGRGRPRSGDVGYLAEWGQFFDSTRETLLAALPPCSVFGALIFISLPIPSRPTLISLGSIPEAAVLSADAIENDQCSR